MTQNAVQIDPPHSKSAHVGIQPIAGYIGAEITGVDLREDLDDEAITAIRAGLLLYKVVFFRNQFIDHSQQIAFSRRFGEVTRSHPYDEDAPSDFPQILTIESKKSGQKKINHEPRWHTDVTALINPPAASVLRADKVPAQGGDTTWTNLVAAYAGLPEVLRNFADTLRAEHRFGGRRPVWLDGGRYDRKISENPLVTEHPVVRVHPETGERALFVQPGFTTRIIGLSPAQSDRILELFFEQITNPAYTVRFRWQPGSIAFWDNRATAHLAPTDLGSFEGDRVLYRTTLAGDVPVGVDGKPSISIQGQAFLGSRPH